MIEYLCVNEYIYIYIYEYMYIHLNIYMYMNISEGMTEHAY
jgi:hypothetical protein